MWASISPASLRPTPATGTGPAARTRASGGAGPDLRALAARPWRRLRWLGEAGSGHWRCRPSGWPFPRPRGRRRGPCLRCVPMAWASFSTVRMALAIGRLVVQRDAGDAGAAFVGHQFEVVGLAADDAAQGDQRVVARRFSARACRASGHFQSAGHGDHGRCLGPARPVRPARRRQASASLLVMPSLKRACTMPMAPGLAAVQRVGGRECLVSAKHGERVLGSRAEKMVSSRVGGQ